MKVACIIPARLESTRFPRKVLAMLGPKPLLQWVWEAASATELFDEITFAIDDQETARLIASFGGRFHMTCDQAESGTDRLVELMELGKVDADVYVNWQGDEPFIGRKMVETLISTAGEPHYDIWTLKTLMTSEEEVESPHNVKVVTGTDGQALYFSRSPIPFYRDVIDFDEMRYYKHIGIYAFTKGALKTIGGLGHSGLEKAEKLEQLRFLERGLKIQVHTARDDSLGIDLPEDLVKAQDRLSLLS